MKILVTGGCGFIGSHLVDALVSERHDVLVLDNLSSGKRENLNPGATLVVGDITEPGIFSPLLEGVDCCFHLAAIASVEISRREWLATHNVNIGGTVALFEAIARSGCHIPVVYASSAAIYGNIEQMPLQESMAPAPMTAYGADKLACEQHGHVAAMTYGIPNIGLRFFNVYGPRQDARSPYSGVISIFYDRLAAGEPITIFGTGEQSRDFIYVGDVVRGLMLAQKKLSGGSAISEVCNLGTGEPISVNELARKIGEILGKIVNVVSAEERRGDIRTSVGDTRKAWELLGFKASTSLIDGLKKMTSAF